MAAIIPKLLEYGAFRTVAPAFDDPELMKLLERNQVVVRAESEKTSTFWVVVANLLPWVLILGLLVWSGKKFQERMGPMGKKGGTLRFRKVQGASVQSGNCGGFLRRRRGIEKRENGASGNRGIFERPGPFPKARRGTAQRCFAGGKTGRGQDAPCQIHGRGSGSPFFQHQRKRNSSRCSSALARPV